MPDCRDARPCVSTARCPKFDMHSIMQQKNAGKTQCKDLKVPNRTKSNIFNAWKHCYHIHVSVENPKTDASPLPASFIHPVSALNGPTRLGFPLHSGYLASPSKQSCAIAPAAHHHFTAQYLWLRRGKRLYLG